MAKYKPGSIRRPRTDIQKLLRGIAEAGYGVGIGEEFEKGIQRQREQLKRAKGVEKVPPYLRFALREYGARYNPAGMIANILRSAPAITEQLGGEERAYRQQAERWLQATPKERKKMGGFPIKKEGEIEKELIRKPLERAVKRPIGLVAPGVYPTVEKFKKDPVGEILEELIAIGITGGVARKGAKGVKQRELQKVLTEIEKPPTTQLELPGVKPSKIKGKLAEEVGGLRYQKKPKYTRLTDPIRQDARDVMPDFGAQEQLHLPLEGARVFKRKGRVPKALKTYLEGAGVKPTDYVEPGLVSKIRPTRKVFAKMGSDVFHAIYEPFTTAEHGRYGWVRNRLEEANEIWRGSTKKEVNRVGIHAVQRDNLANGQDINFRLSPKDIKKYGVSGNNLIKLSPKEQQHYVKMREWFDNYQAGQYERLAKRPDYFPGLGDDAVERAIRTLYPGRGELPPDIQSFATKMRKDALGVNRDINAVNVMKRYVNAEANDLYYGNLMKPTREVVNRLNKAGKVDAANYVQNYAERMVGFPGSLDRQLMGWAEGIDRTLGRTPNPQRAMRVSQSLVDMQYLGGLGFKPSTAIRNLAQLLNTGSEVGVSWTTKGILKFAKNPKQAILEARKAGLVEQVIPDIKIKGGLTANKMERLKSDMLWMFEKTEQANRAITYASATAKWDAMWTRYGQQGALDKFRAKIGFKGIDKPAGETINKFLAEGKLSQARKRYARELTANTQYLYQKGEAPLVTRSQVGKQAWIFQTWWENYAEMMASWTKNKQWSNWVRHIGLTTAALGATSALGLDIRSWVGPSPIPELAMAERLPGVGAPLPRAIRLGLNVPLQAGLAPLFPETAGKKIPAAIKGFTRTLPIFAPGGTAAQQLLRIGTGKRQPIEAAVSIRRARSQKDIKQEMININQQYNNGVITANERDTRMDKLRKEIERRKKEQPRRSK